MIYTEEQLDQIRKYASIYLPISDMAVLMGIPDEVLREDIRNKNNPVYEAYHFAKATSKVELLNQEMILAKVGSPLALENTHRNLLDMEDDE